MSSFHRYPAEAGPSQTQELYTQHTWPNQKTSLQHLQQTIYIAIANGINQHMIPHANKINRTYQTQLSLQNTSLKETLQSINHSQSDSREALAKIYSNIERINNEHEELRQGQEALRREQQEFRKVQQEFGVQIKQLHAMFPGTLPDGLHKVVEAPSLCREDRLQEVAEKPSEHPSISQKAERPRRRAHVSKKGPADSGVPRRRSPRKRRTSQR